MLECARLDSWLRPPLFAQPPSSQPLMKRRRRRSENSTRTRVKFFRIFFLVLGLSVLSGVSVLFGMMMAVAGDLPSLENNAEFKSAANSVLVDRDGKPLATLTADDGRVIVPSKQISQTMKRAVVAIEDKRFYLHHGVDLRGLARAAFTDLTSGKPAQGASTIEQQFIKTVQKDQNDRTLAVPRLPRTSVW